MTLDPYDVPVESGLGMVVEGDRGSLPFSLVHGESLVACAAWALADAGVTVVDASVTWAGIQEAQESFVLHDALCPLTPSAFIAECVRVSLADDVVVVGVRAVTDTVKEVADGMVGPDRMVGATVDRAGLLEVWSPVVLPAAVCAAIEAPDPASFARLVAALRERAEIRFVPAPAEARRVGSPDDVRLLSALTTPGHPERPSAPQPLASPGSP